MRRRFSVRIGVFVLFFFYLRFVTMVLKKRSLRERRCYPQHTFPGYLFSSFLYVLFSSVPIFSIFTPPLSLSLSIKENVALVSEWLVVIFRG